MAHGLPQQVEGPASPVPVSVAAPPQAQPARRPSPTALTRLSAPLVQRCGGRPCPAGACGGSGHEEDSIHRKAAAPGGQRAVPPAVHQVLASPGRPLNAQARVAMERSFARQFADIRIHDDHASEASASEIAASAYSFANHVVLGAGASDASPAGYPLLAHELTHVVQQAGFPGGARPAAVDMGLGSPTEREADAMSEAVAGRH
jgi:uncharacterized protein DUF4157